MYLSASGTTQQLKRDTSANWTSNNPTLLIGEQGLETDTGLTKIGDGVTAWTSLPYHRAPIITTVTSSATPTIIISQDVLVGDILEVTALAAGATFAVSGTPKNGKKILLRWKDNGVSRTTAFPADFRVIGSLTLPSSTTASKWHYLFAIRNETASKWDVLDYDKEP